MFGISKLAISAVVLLVCIQNGTTSHIRLPRFLTKDEVCHKPGFVCKSCTESVYCVQYPDGSLHEDGLVKCTDGTTCKESTGQCSSESNINCDGVVKFECHQPGIFPDASNCNKYHICALDEKNALVEMEGKCSKDWVFDPMTSRCTMKLENGICPELVPKCERSFQTGPIERNPSFYYICRERQTIAETTVLHPELYACPYNYVYKNGECVDPTPPSGLDSEGLCVNTGFFYDPKDCFKFIECRGTGAAPVGRACTSCHKFSPEASVCVKLDCDTCKN